MNGAILVSFTGFIGSLGMLDTEVKDRLSKLIEGIVKAIVDNPDNVEVNVATVSYRSVIELRTAVSDVGQVIGKKGSVISSIRGIVQAFGGKHNLRLELDYLTELENKYQNRPRSNTKR